MELSVKQYRVVSQFRCLGADCPDTCCRGWDMPADSKQRSFYEQHAPELLAAIDGEQGTMRRVGGQQQCAQLCEGVCTIHARYGEAFLGDACHFYPRLLNKIGDDYVMAGALSCPEMLRLVLSESEPFACAEAAPMRLPLYRRNLVPEGWTNETVHAVHGQMMAQAADTACTPEQAVDAMVQWVAAQTGEPLVEEVIALVGDPQAIYYALALTEAFGEPNVSRYLADIMAVMAQQLDCQFDRTTRTMTMGVAAAQAHPLLLQRWNSDACVALMPVLRRWLQAQIAATYFPFGGFPDATMMQRAAVLVQRFATVRLALMCYVSSAGVPPDETVVIRVIQGLARFMDHLADAKLTLMIHRDSGWENVARLRGIIRGA